MNYRSIHAPASGTDDDEHVLRSAAELAALQEGRLTVVSAFMPPAVQMAFMAPPNLYMDPALIDELEKAHQDLKANVRAHAEAAAAHAGLKFGKDVVIAEYDADSWGSAEHWIALSDLVVVGPSQAKGSLAPDLLLRARAPVLVARPGLQLKPMTAAVAWDGGVCAGRAVRASLPLLAGATRVILLQQAEGLSEERRRLADLGRLSDYLARHGVDTVVESVGGEGDSGEAILEAARCCSANVLVCGAYGHSRLAETILGGVTRSVLNAAFPAAFMAH